VIVQCTLYTGSSYFVPSLLYKLLYKKKVKRGGKYEAITDDSTHAMVHTTQGTQLNAKIGATE